MGLALSGLRLPLASHPGPWAVVSSGDFAALARAVIFAGTKRSVHGVA